MKGERAYIETMFGDEDDERDEEYSDRAEFGCPWNDYDNDQREVCQDDMAVNLIHGFAVLDMHYTNV